MVAVLALLLAVEPVAPQVTLPLEEYARLKQLEERPSLTVVDLVRLEGSFARRDLAIVFTGRATGRLPTAEVLSAEGVRLHSCSGDALVTRADGGLFAITPSAGRFQARCKLALDGSDRVEGQTTAAVLEITGAVEDGEWVSSGGDGGARHFTVVRRLAGKPEEDLPPSVTARYRLTLLPDETRFVHLLELRNPSRRHRSFEVALGSGERVETVEAKVAWDREGDRYRFELPPGDTTVTLQGRLSGARFVPPVEASLQYLLLESHPLVLPEIRTEAKRVGVGETGLSPGYRGAQAFLLDGSRELTWTAKRLEALKTAGLSIDALSQVYFLGADGRARGEATLEVNNQGASAFTLPTEAEPTFVSLDGEPSFLTRDAEKRLFLPLGQGRQSVLVQDVRPFRARLGFAALALDLPRAGVPASAVSVELRYPREWIPLYESLPPGIRFGALSLAPLLAAAFVGLLLERLLALLGVAARRRVRLGGALALAAVLLPDLALWAGVALAVLLLGLGAVALVRMLHGWRLVLALGVPVGALAILLPLLAALTTPRWKGEPEPHKDVKFMRVPEAPPPQSMALPRPDQADRWSGGAESYQGVPARIELPRGARQTRFARELVDTAAPPTLHVVMVSALLVTWLEALLLLPLLALAFAFAARGELAAAGRAYLARLRPPAVPAPPAAP